MTTPSMWPRYVARGLAVLVWIAGSAYLVRNELSMPTPDWVVIATMPLIWAAVLALPILAHHAYQSRQWLAAILLALAAVVGTCFTMQGTISRQSEARDGKVAEAQAANFKRSELMAELERAQSRYDDANRYADLERGSTCGQRCKDWELRAREVRAHIDQLTTAIAGIGADKPVASGEKRLAAMIALLPFVKAPVAAIEAGVALVLPSLFGVFLEMAGLAFAFYGFHPVEVRVSASAAKPEAPARVSEGEADTAPPKPRKRSKRGDRRQAIIAKIREQTLAGQKPSFKLVRSRYKLSAATASRYRNAALAAAH